MLGAAKIAPPAIVRPARAVDEAEVVAIAARDPDRARAFASKHHIPKVHDSYSSLLDDPDVDAIYNPLPNGLHGRWTIAALEAGKHVLCEKPFTANAAEAEEVAAVARRTGLVVMEAFHYRYHPMAIRMVSLLRSGELGPIRHIEAWMCTPLLPAGDIRWQLGLAGGSTMDLGCYTIHLTRSLAGAEPEVVAAEARERSAGVDRWLRADMRLPDGATGSHHRRDAVAPAPGARCTGDVRAGRDPRAQPICAAHLPSNGRARTGHSEDGTLHPHADVRIPVAGVRRCSAARRADPDRTGRLDRDDARDRRLLSRRGDGRAAADGVTVSQQPVRGT